MVQPHHGAQLSRSQGRAAAHRQHGRHPSAIMHKHLFCNPVHALTRPCTPCRSRRRAADQRQHERRAADADADEASSHGAAAAYPNNLTAASLGVLPGGAHADLPAVVPGLHALPRPLAAPVRPSNLRLCSLGLGSAYCLACLGRCASGCWRMCAQPLSPSVSHGWVRSIPQRLVL